MKGLGIVRETVAASVALALVSLGAGFAAGQPRIGLAVALGLVVGAANGELVQWVVRSGSPFVVSSLARMAGVSAAAIGLAFIAGASPTAVLLGVAAAQVVMVGASIREGLRA